MFSKIDLFPSESKGFSRGAGHLEMLVGEQWKAGIEEGHGGGVGGGHVESLSNWCIRNPVHPEFRMKYSRAASVPQN